MAKRRKERQPNKPGDGVLERAIRNIAREELLGQSGQDTAAPPSKKRQ